MPFIKPPSSLSPSSPSPSSYAATAIGVRASIITTTIFSGGLVSPTVGSTTKTKTPVPIPAIVGGIVGGAVLALMAMSIWIWWGRAIRRDLQKRDREREAYRRTRYNTIRNAEISRPRNYSYRPLLRQSQDEKRVKFVGDEKSTDVNNPKVDPTQTKHMLFDSPTTPPPRPAWTAEQRIRRTPSVIWPIPRNPLKKLSNSSVRGNREGDSLDQANQSVNKTMSPKASNISATSQRSNNSGDSNQGRVRTSLIVAALGNLGNRNTLNTGDRHSTSSLWSFLFRSLPNARSSQHSSEHTSAAAVETQSDVGTAL